MVCYSSVTLNTLLAPCSLPPEEDVAVAFYSREFMSPSNLLVGFHGIGLEM